MDFLLNADRELFLALNGFYSSFLDFLMYWLSTIIIWIPLYGYLIYWLFKKYQVPAWRVIFVAIVLVALTDQISSSLLKPWVARLRPCHEPGLVGLVHLVNGHCGGQYGFVSSHAANTFGLAVFMGFFLRKSGPPWAAWAMLGWAAVVSYSRIYLGAHYPGDVLGGGLLGAALAGMLALTLKRWLPGLATKPDAKDA